MKQGNREEFINSKFKRISEKIEQLKQILSVTSETKEKEKLKKQLEIEGLKFVYGITDEKELEEYEAITQMVAMLGKKPSKCKKLIIIGGQSGAGKSRLIPIAKKELEHNDVIVDFDELRSYHPSYKIVNELYPEISHQILHEDTEEIKCRLLDEARRRNFNVVYEGALRNTQGFLDFAQDFRDNDYFIQMMIMAVPKLESYGSTFVRYADALLMDQTPRWVEKYAHDGSYKGVPITVEAFKNKKLADSISVYVRNDEAPKRIYTTDEKQFKDALEAIEFGRESGCIKAVEDYNEKYEFVYRILSRRKPELLENLRDWEQLYNEEKQKMQLKEKTEKIIDE